MKRMIVIAAALLFACSLFGCAEKKILHCDGCGREVPVSTDSDMTEDWIVLCKDCKKKLE